MTQPALPRTMPGLYTAAEVRALSPRIQRMWRRGRPSSRRTNDRAAMEEEERYGLTLAWATCAAVANETSVVLPLARLLREELVHEKWDLTHFVEALVLLAGQPDAPREALLALASTRDDAIERGLARFFDPARPAELEALRHLAAYAHEAGAQLARERLAKAGALDWWRGHFASDPCAGLTEAEREAASPKLRELIELRGRYAAETAGSGERALLARGLATQVCSLPARAAVLAAEPILLAGEGELPKGDRARILCGIAEHAGAPELFLKLARTWEGVHLPARSELMLAALPKLPLLFRERVCPLLFAELERQPLADLVDDAGLADTLAELLGALWPDTLDPRPLADLLLACSRAAPDEEYLRIAGSFCHPLESAGQGRPWVRELFAEGLALGFDGPWRTLSHSLLLLAPSVLSAEELRRAREEALDQGIPGPALDWAMKELSPAERLARYLDPRVRPALFRHHLKGPLLALARKELRQGRLNAFEAASLLSEVAELWGGSAPMLLHLLREAEDGGDETLGNEANATAWEEAHGVELAGPPTEAEWAELRRLRAPLDPAEASRSIDLAITFACGPWDPEDKRFFEGVCKHLIDSHKGERAVLFAAVAAAKGAADHLELVASLERIDDYGFGHGEAVAQLRGRLGLAPYGLPEDDEALEGGG